MRRPDIADAQFIDVLSAAGGLVPAASGPLISDTFLPVLRADLRIAAAYRHDDRRAPLPCPIIVLSGTGDPFTTSDVMPEWQRHTSGRCTIHEFPGGHFFLFDQAARIGALMTRLATEMERSAHVVD